MEPTAKMLEWYHELPFEKWVEFLNRNSKSPTLRRLQEMSLVDYSEMEKEILDAPEPKTLEAGSEAKLRILNVRTGTSDTNDCNWFSPVYDVPDNPMVKEFNDFFWELDKEKLTPKEYQRSLYKFKTFVQCFRVDLSRPLDIAEGLTGLEGYAIVGTKKDDVYGEQNTIRKYVVPK